MSVAIAQTREELRQAVADNIGVVRVSAATSNGTTSTLIDSSLENADDIYNGWHVILTSGTNDGEIRTVDDYTGSTKTLTLRGDVLPASTADGDTYELFTPDFPPERIHRFINRAIRTITRKGAPDAEDISLHTTQYQRVYPRPTGMLGVSRIEQRVAHTKLVVHTCDSVFDELVDGDVTASVDTEDRREGSASNKFVLADGLAAGDIIATDTVSLDISRYTHIEGWVKSTVATSAGDLQLLLDDTASCASPLETLNLPALTADRWTWFRVALANPELDTSIISIGLENNTDIGAATVWLDGIEATVDGSEYWQVINRNFWKLGKERDEIVFEREAMDDAPYALLKLTGAQQPTELSSDSDSSDVESEYVIAKATALAMRAIGDRRADNRDAAMVEADRLEGLAERALLRQQTVSGMRWW